MKMPAIMFACAIEELEEAVDNKRPISSLMKQKWIDDAGGFVGDCETLLRLFRSESTDAWERNAQRATDYSKGEPCQDAGQAKGQLQSRNCFSKNRIIRTRSLSE
jgi:hypothetical protein